MSVPRLPALPALPHIALNLAPSGNGWDFTPDQGWGWDGTTSNTGGSYGGFDIGGFFGGPDSGGLFGGPGPGGGSDCGPFGLFCNPQGPSIGVTLPGGSGGSGSSGGGVSGKVGSFVGGALSSVLGIPAINWGRIAAFLLGLLLIAGGLYLIKPVQQVINENVRAAGEGLAA